MSAEQKPVADLIEGKCGLRKLMSELAANGLGMYSRDLDRAIDKLQALTETNARLSAEIARLTEALTTANANHEKFERQWYLVSDERDALRDRLNAPCKGCGL